MKQNSIFARLLIFSNIILLTFAGFVLLASFDKNDNNEKFKEITVERINIVMPMVLQ